MSTPHYRLGIDIGSTTAKIVLLDPAGHTAFTAYRRHNAETLATLRLLLSEAQDALGDAPVEFLVTGSAGLGVAEKYHLPLSRRWSLPPKSSTAVTRRCAP